MSVTTKSPETPKPKLWRLSDASRQIVELALTASKHATDQREHIYRDADHATIMANLDYPQKRWCEEQQRAVFLGLNETGRTVLLRLLVFASDISPEAKDELKRLINRHSRAHLSTLSLNIRLAKAKSEEHRQDILRRNFNYRGTK